HPGLLPGWQRKVSDIRRAFRAGGARWRRTLATRAQSARLQPLFRPNTARPDYEIFHRGRRASRQRRASPPALDHTTSRTMVQINERYLKVLLQSWTSPVIASEAKQSRL